MSWFFADGSFFWEIEKTLLSRCLEEPVVCCFWKAVSRQIVKFCLSNYLIFNFTLFEVDKHRSYQ